MDVYKANLDGQTLKLPDALPDGPLCLEVAADPLGLLVETVEDDNATAIAILITGNEVRQVSSSVCD